MKFISQIDSLMMFNRRVLYSGIPSKDKHYSITELENLLFFNSVFYTNMEEMFTKYNMSGKRLNYLRLLSLYNKNISSIIDIMKTDYNIIIDDSNTFERRFSMHDKLSNAMIQYQIQLDKPINFKFKENEIYYISNVDYKYILISYIPKNSGLYSKALSCANRDGITYYKTDKMIRDYLGDTIAVRVVTSDDNPYRIMKLEYNGDKAIFDKVSSVFDTSTVFSSNKFIYTDDIKYILKSNNRDTKRVYRQKLGNVNVEEYLHNDDLIEYPRDSFDEYLNFLRRAAKSDNVKSIDLTLYRIGKNPSIYYILRDAVLKGIKVNVNIELYASGETKLNTIWMNEMKDIGIDVFNYGGEQTKVHTKLTLVTFKNGKQVCQIGTGNYNYDTTSQYTDLSMLTSDNIICSNIKKVFNLLKGKEHIAFDDSLLVTKFNARQELIRLIDEEAHKGVDGFISFKCNALDDTEIIRHLDIAAKNGCSIQLVIRGICTWVPDELGDNVIIKSVIWDKLEHSRVYYFNRKNPIVYFGSLDLVTNKIENRIETLVKVTNPDISVKLCNYINRYIKHEEGWLLTKDCRYVR